MLALLLKTNLTWETHLLQTWVPVKLTSFPAETLKLMCLCVTSEPNFSILNRQHSKEALKLYKSA